MCEIFGSNFFIPAVTQICDRKWEKQINKEVWTGHSEGFGYTPSFEVGTAGEGFTSSEFPLWMQTGSQAFIVTAGCLCCSGLNQFSVVFSFYPQLVCVHRFCAIGENDFVAKV